MTTILRRSEGAPARLSFPQERLFLLDQIMPGVAAYNVPTLVRIGTTLDDETLRSAFERVVSRHEILRTSIELQDGLPVQRAFAAPRFELTVADLRSTPHLERDREADRLLSELVARPFDISGDVLLRAGLVHLDGEDLLLVVLHHAGSDHISASLLFNELDAIYRALTDGVEPELPDLPVQYADFAEWQRERMKSDVLEELLGYWTEQLRGAPERLEIPSDRPRPSAQSYRGSWSEFSFNPELVAPLRELARRERVSMFMLLLAAFETVLHRYSGAADLVVGTPVSGRHHDETSSLLGYFSNTLALRTDLSRDPSFRELLERVKLTTLGALAYQELPFEKLVEVMNPERARSHSPLFQVLFGYDLLDSEPPQLAGLPLERLPIPGWQWARFDLSMIVHDLPDGSLELHVGYSTDLFDASRIDWMVGHLRTVLDAVVRDPDQRLSRIPLMAGAERRMVLEEWNATASPYDRRCLHELFAEQAARRPEAPAVSSEHGQLTYGELDARANQLAHELIELGVGPGTVVGICVERSTDLVVALLGVLKSGAAYVPVDPTYPPERQELILADAAVPVLLTQERLLGVIDPNGATVVCLDRDRERIAGRSREAPEVPADPARLAYQIYTSGSTGRPKGVMIAHESVANLIAHMRERPGLTDRDVVANLTTPAFDLSVPDWYLPLTTGAHLVIVPREATLDGVSLADWLARTGATFVQATPTTWQMLVEGGWQGNDALKVVCGGEALPPALVDELLSRGASLWHMYGPTETTVWSSAHELGAAEGPPPIGGPIANTRFYVLDENREPVPIGIPGELYIGGDGLARGYHNRPELTADKFVEDPFTDGARLYRTGDLMRWREGGTLEFLGRIDLQVKLHGYRIELGEIEAVLADHPSVAAAVAAVRDFGPGDRRLVAYLVAAGGAPDVDELRRYLRGKLPPFMVPHAFVTLDAFPVNANGKLDRAALPAPSASRPELSREYAEPETPVQQALAEVWVDVLGVEQVGLDDDFFDLGGHSLLGVRMLARVEDELDVAVSLARLFDVSTVRQLAEVVTTELLEGVDDEELAGLLAEPEAAER